VPRSWPPFSVSPGSACLFHPGRPLIFAAITLGVCSMRSPAKRSIYPNRHNTSVTLEDAFWQSLKEIAQRRRMSVSDLIGEIDAQPRQGNLSSALRLFVLKFYRSQMPDAG
jgi:predicted DNA-binding ribbon-helix-helix protein